MNSAILFMPAGDERKLQKIPVLAPCGLVFDLEDAVALDQKASARAGLQAAMGAARSDGRDALVRINALGSAWWEADVHAAVAAGATVLLVPKAEDGAALGALDVVLEAAERSAGCPRRSTRLIALIETAAGYTGMSDVLRAPRVDAATLGLADLALDLGTSWSDAMLASPPLFLAERSALSLWSRSLRKAPPWDAVFLALESQAEYEADVDLGRRLGCQGKFVIHPRQIEAVHRAYAISEDDRAHAQAIVDTYAAALLDGRGAILLHGMLIDEPVVAQARITLERSART